MAYFEKLKSGKTRALVRIQGVCKSKSFHTLGQARTWARALEMEIQDGTYHKRRAHIHSPLLRDVIGQYIDKYTSAKKSAANERYSLNVILRQPISHERIPDITPDDW